MDDFGLVRSLLWSNGTGHIIMPSTVDTYRSAAREHLARAQELFSSEGTTDYYLAHYLAGLAVECHLRAYLLRVTREFNSRHDLNRLATESGFYKIVPAVQVSDFSTKLGLLNLRWRSDHRFYSERQFLAYMSDIRAEFSTPGARVDGDRKKNLSRTVLNLAHEIINQGEAQWGNG